MGTLEIIIVTILLLVGVIASVVVIAKKMLKVKKTPQQQQNNSPKKSYSIGGWLMVLFAFVIFWLLWSGDIKKTIKEWRSSDSSEVPEAQPAKRQIVHTEVNSVDEPTGFPDTIRIPATGTFTKDDFKRNEYVEWGQAIDAETRAKAVYNTDITFGNGTEQNYAPSNQRPKDISVPEKMVFSSTNGREILLPYRKTAVFQ